MKTEDISFIALFILLAIACIAGFIQAAEIEELQQEINNQSCESCNMRFNKTNIKGIAGVHRYQDYICVSTTGYKAEEIGGVFSHEMAHFHVKEDYHHFCEEYTRK